MTLPEAVQELNNILRNGPLTLESIANPEEGTLVAVFSDGTQSHELSITDIVEDVKLITT